ncbi:SPOR domain-containing protein [Deinococcus radiotolerans]|uniref:SPOR domain-containing protein n=1 Tax=Deinococcus radiotolerans TaxID=1309407 RepID=A0ABQ2FEY1_9DEIO|nr:SPOR domain-containing protein [Deinococcus radiotolerans]GGK91737.1 hypothetical protein GCM10010844_07800 [Deinococcus radiotolerans]
MSRAAGPRRWPDLMIGALVVLLMGGFGTLLLRPQSTAPVSAPTSDHEADAAPVIPGAPGSTDSAGSTATAQTTAITPTDPDTTQTAAGDAADTTPTDAGTTTGTDTSAPATEAPPVIAAAPIGTPDPALTGQTTDTPADTAAPTDSADTTPDDTTTSPAARAGGAVPTSEQRTPLRSDYRITLGTFSSVEAAQKAAQGVSTLGYTVYPIDLGSQVVAQIGPFSDETTARQALADVQRAAPSAVLYPPKDRSLSTNAPATTTPATNTPAATESTPAATPAPSSDSPTYLQVGAFDRLESAQNLVQQLRDLGYNPTVNAPADKKVTVLVGPYTGDPLSRTEARLKQNGLDSFRVR